MNKALGLIEVVGLTNAIVAADECVKAATVNLLGIEKVSGGIVTVKVIGDVSAVTAAVESGRSMVEHSGMFRTSHVIPRLNEELLDLIYEKETTEEEKETESEVEQEVTVENTEEVISEVVETVSEEFATITNVDSDEVTEDSEGEVEVKEEVLVIESQKKEKSSKTKAKNEELTKETLSKRTVKELRQLAISTKVCKTWKEVKQLKKDDLIDKLLK